MELMIYDYFFDYLQDSHLYRTMQGVTMFCLLWILFRKIHHSEDTLFTLEEERIIEDWNPEPLVCDVPAEHHALHPHVVSSGIGHFINVDGVKCLDLATHNYLRVVNKHKVNERAIATLQTYGVGSCGPRAFYGTSVAHLDLEEALAEFLGQEDAIVFSYGFSTISTVIPAYARRGDIIFAGLQASRSDVRYFEHNNSRHLERLFQEKEVVDQKEPKKAASCRRFVVVEGIYINTGNICPLPSIVRLAQRYRARIILDESVSIATLGATGRGLAEHFRINRDAVDVTVGSLEMALGSIGGFSVGSDYIIEHQRMNAQGYGYSASLPPLLATAAQETLDNVLRTPDQENQSILRKLHGACQRLHGALETLRDVGLHLGGHPQSVIKHLSASAIVGDPEKQDLLLRNIANECVKNGVAVTSSAYLSQLEGHQPRPSLRITANVDLTEEEIILATEVLRQAAKKCIDSN